jgi:class 3 adenylate cyclase/predicted ATPase
MMDFYDVVARTVQILQQQGRVTYGGLKLQFKLDDETLEALKDELRFSQPVVDENGQGLVWTGDPPSLAPDAPRGTETEIRFHALLPVVTMLLQREGRFTYRTLKWAFGIDDALLGAIRKELRFKRLAIDEDGEGLAWIGEGQPVRHPLPVPVSAPATSEAATAMPFELAPSAIATDAPHSASATPPGPIRNSPEAERRQLTVMFCDLADSTKLSQQLDPEDLREVIRAYQDTAAEVIQQYEGHIAQYLGDGLLMYFGWPVAHEDDAQRAGHAGLGIVEAIKTGLNPRLQQEKGVQLSVRLGIHTGPVVVGEMGGGGRHENLATGETVNIAARLEGLAQPNTLVISAVTERLVRGSFALEHLGPQMLKGVAEPMDVFRVLGPMEVHEDEIGAVGVPFLVGRDEEAGLLLRRWEQSKAGLGQVVLISGEAGIGKSSLVSVVRTHVAQQGYTRITFRCSPYHTNSALYPVITHLEQRLGFDRADIPDVKFYRLEQVLRTTHLSLEESVPLLAALLSVPLEGRYPVSTLSPQQQRQQTLDTLVGWLMEESERKPVLAVWEDMHWGDPSTLEMLGLVLEQTPTVPMLNVLTFRPEFESPWPTRSHMTPITLNRLERSQVEGLITHLADGKALPTEVVAHIVAKTDGVPLYVEELTRMLLASDLLGEEADQYVLTGPLTTVAIPDTLQDSLMARLDQMNTAKEVAQLGSVLGREFAYEMLQVIATQDEETIQASLARLVEAELLYQRGRPPRARYVFKHALIQDAAYASLLRSTRQQVHQQIAQLLETRFPEVVETQPELVAYHFTEAAQNEAAVPYWQRAAQDAIQRSAYVEAVNHLTRGLDLLERLPATPDRVQRALDMRIALGPALVTIKGYSDPDVEPVFRRARTLCQQVGDSTQLFHALWGLWRFYYGRAEMRPSQEIGEQLLALAERQDDSSLLVMAGYAVGTTLSYRGVFASAQDYLERARGHMAHCDLQQQQALTVRYGIAPGVYCLFAASRVQWALGYPDQALHTGQEMLDMAQALPHPISSAIARYFMGRVHQIRREVQAAQTHLEAALAMVANNVFAQGVALMQFLRGWVLATQGQHEEGVAQMRQGMAATLHTGASFQQPMNTARLAEAYARMGQAREGLSLVDEALAMVDATGVREYEAELHRIKGVLLLHLAIPDFQQAEISLSHALGVARHQHAKSWELRVATSLARLWQSQGKRQEAHDLLAPVYEWFTEGFDTADLQEAKALLEELA